MVAIHAAKKALGLCSSTKTDNWFHQVRARKLYQLLASSQARKVHGGLEGQHGVLGIALVDDTRDRQSLLIEMECRMWIERTEPSRCCSFGDLVVQKHRLLLKISPFCDET